MGSKHLKSLIDGSVQRALEKNKSSEEYYKNLNKHTECTKCYDKIPRDKYKKDRSICKKCYSKYMLENNSSRRGDSSKLDSSNKLVSSREQDDSNELDSSNKFVSSRKQDDSNELDSSNPQDSSRKQLVLGNKLVQGNKIILGNKLVLGNKIIQIKRIYQLIMKQMLILIFCVINYGKLCPNLL